MYSGPGASSLLGAFHEIGPCAVAEDGKTTTKSDLSWTEFSNMLFIEYVSPHEPGIRAKERMLNHAEQ